MLKSICFLALYLWSPLVSAESKPNVVIVLTDDLGYGDVSFLNPDSKIKTPHMDALAKAGVWATDAHSPSAVCTPTRYAMLTGRYAWRTKELKKGVLMPWDGPVIKSDRLTLPDMMKTEGYDTALIGKWHLGFHWPWAQGTKPPVSEIGGVMSKAKLQMFDWTKPITGGPTAAGFDYYFGDDVPNFPPYAYIENEQLTCSPVYINAKSLASLGTRGFIHGSGPGQEGWTFEQVLPTITDKTVGYINERAKSATPYFLMFSTTSPHTPVVPTKDFQKSSKASTYGDFVAQTDAAIGAVIDALKKVGHYDNTILIVTSDNGPDQYHRNLFQSHNHSPAGKLRGMKWDIWEGGHRVPFIVSWPKGGLKGGRRIDALISLTDLYATLASILSVELKDSLAPDSINVLPSLLEGQDVRTEMVYHSGGGKLGLRRSEWVYLEAGGKTEKSAYIQSRGIIPDNSKKHLLYNLKLDLPQTKNLSSEHPDRLQKMKTRLQEIKSQTSANR